MGNYLIITNNTNDIQRVGLLALLVIFSWSCNDNSANPCGECENFPESDAPTTLRIKQKPNQRHAPCFNPNNPNEFVYYKVENHHQGSIVRYNLLTQQEDILANGSIISCPDWGANNKIAYIDKDYQLRTIDLNNGNIITQHTFAYYHLWPQWLNDSVVVCQFSFNLGVPSFRMSLNTNTNQFDTLRNQTFVNGAILPASGLLAYCKNTKHGTDLVVSTYRGIRRTVLSGSEMLGRKHVTGMEWIDSRNLLLATYRAGIFTFNTVTSKRKCIRIGCDTRSYRYLSVSPDRAKIVAARVDATDYTPGGGNWTEESKIVIMNIDGSDEQVLFE